MSKENVFNSARIFIKKLLSGEVDTIIKKIWYVFLLVVGSVYVWKSRYDIYSLSAINASHVISIIWLIVIVTPIFSEVELFGFKFKKEVEKIEEQVKEIKASMLIT